MLENAVFAKWRLLCNLPLFLYSTNIYILIAKNMENRAEDLSVHIAHEGYKNIVLKFLM